MKTNCLSIEEIAALSRAGTVDDRRRHVESCARCFALAAEYAAFVGGLSADGADVADANARLGAFIQERIEQEQVEGTPAARFAGTRRARGGFFSSPRRSLVLAAAAVVVLVAVTVLRTQLTPEPVLLRGDAGAVQLATYTVLAGGSVPLVWPPLYGADAYRITILGEDLAELRAMGPVAGNTYVFAPAEHGLAPGRYFWEVTALAGGDAVGSAGPAPLFVR